MANLTVTTCRLVRGSDEVLLTAPVAEVGTQGMYFRLNTTTGKLEKGNGTSAGELGNIGGALLDDVTPISMTGTIVLADSNAIIDLGDALDALAFDAPVFIGDTDGTLSDTAGTVSRKYGDVIPGFGNASGVADKLLMVRSI